MKTRTARFSTRQIALILLAVALASTMAGQLLINRSAASAALQPSPIVVTTNADENDGTPDPGVGTGTSLREAIEAANSSAGDDTIIFDPRVTGQSYLNAPLPALDSNIVITGPGANLFTLRRVTADNDGRGGTNFRIFRVNAGKTVSISGLTISGGSEANGGGIANFGNLTVNGLTVSGNAATSGGGIYNSSGATLVVNNSTVSGNTTGGGIFNQGTLTLTNSTIAGNTATGSGGGVGSSGALTIRNSTIAGNTASSGGGISSSGTSNLSSTIVAKNSAATGADVSGTISSADYNLIQNTAGWSINANGGHNLSGTDPLLRLNGGIPFLTDNGGPTQTIALLPGSPAIDQGLSNGLTTDQRGKPRILDNPVITNAAGGNGADIGALENETALLRVTTNVDHDDGACNSADCTLREAINAANAATLPVEIDFAAGVTGTINLGLALAALNNDLKILGPGANLLTVRRDTGGAYRIFTVNTGKTVLISGLALTGGNETNGGGIANSGNLTINGLTISGNTATNGGGIYNNSSATLTVQNSTISGNTAASGGGVSNNGTLTVTNSTVANNTSTGNGGGLDNAGSLTVNNSTVAGNTAASGGGISTTGTLNLSSTIVAANSAGTYPDVSGVIATASFNLIQATAGWSISTPGVNNQSSVNPLFELGTDSKPLLKNNGGPTQTIALLCGSPAVDTGTANGFTTEQRGLQRTINDPDKFNADDSTDIGAFERQQSCNNAPVARCKGSITLTAVDGCEAMLTPQDLDNGSSDPEGDPIQLFASATSLPVGGPHTVTLLVADNHENVASCTTQVTVVENTPPVAICKTATVFLDSTGQARVSARDVDDGSSDNCGLVSLTVSPNTFTCANLGPNTVTLTVRDASGNQASCSTTVFVRDIEVPVITCPTNIVATLPANTPDASMAVAYVVNATDNCAGVNVTTSKASGSLFTLGTTTVTATATDASGNSSTCSFTVTVIYRFTGFFNPISNPPVVNEVKAGQSIPIKFSLSGNKGLNIFAPGSPSSGTIACNSSDPVTVLGDTGTAGNSSLSYDASSDQYNYTWKTENTWAGTCRQLVVQLNDGSIHRANFRFK